MGIHIKFRHIRLLFCSFVWTVDQSINAAKALQGRTRSHEVMMCFWHRAIVGSLQKQMYATFKNQSCWRKISHSATLCRCSSCSCTKKNQRSLSLVEFEWLFSQTDHKNRTVWKSHLQIFNKPKRFQGLFGASAWFSTGSLFFQSSGQVASKQVPGKHQRGAGLKSWELTMRPIVLLAHKK